MKSDVFTQVSKFADELTAIRRDLHEHPEIGFEEHRTSDIVAEYLENLGIEVHRNIGKTGVVGVLAGIGRTVHWIARGYGRFTDRRADKSPMVFQNAGRHACLRP